jgi:hypothetical protein
MRELTESYSLVFLLCTKGKNENQNFVSYEKNCKLLHIMKTQIINGNAV